MSGFVADSQGHTTSGPTITWREYEGLLARVRELKAQAERDAKVVRHAAEYVALNTEMDDLNEADIDYIERSDELWLRADKAWESLCAALAAKEEGE